MLTKIALATAISAVATCAAFAAADTDPKGGYRELGPGGVVTDGVNPAFHPSLRSGAGNSYGYASGACAKPSKNSHHHCP